MRPIPLVPPVSKATLPLTENRVLMFVEAIVDLRLAKSGAAESSRGVLRGDQMTGGDVGRWIVDGEKM